MESKFIKVVNSVRTLFVLFLHSLIVVMILRYKFNEFEWITIFMLLTIIIKQSEKLEVKNEKD